MARRIEQALLASGVILAPVSELEFDTRQLGEQLKFCLRNRSRVFAIRCHLESVHRFVSRRMLSSLMLATLAISLLAFYG